MNRCVLGPCGRWSWKWKPKDANGRANDSNNDCQKKPAAKATFPPLSGRRLVHRRTRPMPLRTAVGVIKLEVLHVQDPADEHWAVRCANIGA